jgi:leucyl aminopeptidase
MKIAVRRDALENVQSDLLVISLFKESKFIPDYIRQLDNSLNGIIGNIILNKDFKCELNETFLIHTQNKVKARRILLLGLGKKRDFNNEVARIVSGKAALQVREIGLSSYSTILYDEIGNIFELSENIILGTRLALYTYSRYKSNKNDIPKSIKSVTIIIQNKDILNNVKQGIKSGIIISKAVEFARDITNTPSSDCTPSFLADTAIQLSELNNRLKVKVLDLNDIENLGMGGLSGVSKGSNQPPKLIIIEYLKKNILTKPIIIVGKAVTFDSGGISLKPSEKMNEMKYDKAGGAAVIALMQATAKLNLNLNIIGLIPATENLPGGNAYKPGDIVKIYGGKTVEIINTDAEGRLILADALSYGSKKYSPQGIIDIATLTGACIIALGTNVSGLFANNKQLKMKIIKAAEQSNEKVWELPLFKEYQEQIKSNIADIKNSGGRPAGAISAAIFLSNFVNNTKWAHLDIAGTAWTQEGNLEKSYIPKGATGIAVRLIIQLLRTWNLK